MFDLVGCSQAESLQFLLGGKENASWLCQLLTKFECSFHLYFLWKKQNKFSPVKCMLFTGGVRKGRSTVSL